MNFSNVSPDLFTNNVRQNAAAFDEEGNLRKGCTLRTDGTIQYNCSTIRKTYYKFINSVQTLTAKKLNLKVQNISNKHFVPLPPTENTLNKSVHHLRDSTKETNRVQTSTEPILHKSSEIQRTTTSVVSHESGSELRAHPGTIGQHPPPLTKTLSVTSNVQTTEDTQSTTLKVPKKTTHAPWFMDRNFQYPPFNPGTNKPLGPWTPIQEEINQPALQNEDEAPTPTSKQFNLDKANQEMLNVEDPDIQKAYAGIEDKFKPAFVSRLVFIQDMGVEEEGQSNVMKQFAEQISTIQTLKDPQWRSRLENLINAYDTSKPILDLLLNNRVGAAEKLFEYCSHPLLKDNVINLTNFLMKCEDMDKKNDDQLIKCLSQLLQFIEKNPTQSETLFKNFTSILYKLNEADMFGEMALILKEDEKFASQILTSSFPKTNSGEFFAALKNDPIYVKQNFAALNDLNRTMPKQFKGYFDTIYNTYPVLIERRQLIFPLISQYPKNCEVLWELTKYNAEPWVNTMFETFAGKPEILKEIAARAKAQGSLTLELVIDVLNNSNESALRQQFKTATSFPLARELNKLKTQQPALYQHLEAWSKLNFPDVDVSSLEKHPYNGLFTKLVQKLNQSPGVGDILLNLTNHNTDTVFTLLEWKNDALATAGELMAKGHQDIVYAIAKNSRIPSEAEKLLSFINERSDKAQGLGPILAKNPALCFALSHNIHSEINACNKLINILHSHPEFGSSFEAYLNAPAEEIILTNAKLKNILSIYEGLSLIHDDSEACKIMDCFAGRPKLLQKMAELLADEPNNVENLDFLYLAAQKVQQFSKVPNGEKIKAEILNLIELERQPLLKSLFEISENPEQIPLFQKLLDMASTGRGRLLDMALPILKQTSDPYINKLKILIPQMNEQQFEAFLQLSKDTSPIASSIKTQILRTPNEEVIKKFSSQADLIAMGYGFDLEWMLRVKDNPNADRKDQLMADVLEAGDKILFEKLNQVQSQEVIDKICELNIKIPENKYIIEQLLDIYSTISSKYSQYENVLKSPVYDYCLKLVKESVSYEDTVQSLGQVLYLAGKQEHFDDSNFSTSVPETKSRISGTFQNNFKLQLLALKNLKTQSGVAETSKQMNVLVSQSILTQDEVINKGIIPFLKNFIQETGVPCEQTLDVLNAIENDPMVTRILYRPCTPQNPNSPAAKNIQEFLLETIGDDALTDQNVKLTILSALMTKLRQGAVGSCFATAVAIGIQQNNLPAMLSDMVNLARNGMITRRVNNAELQFPYVRTAMTGTTEHPFLRGWEYALSSMSESGQSSIKKTRTVDFFVGEYGIIQQQLKKLKTDPQVLESLNNKMQSVFLNKMIHFYDPNRETGTVAPDGSSTKGVWVLHDKRNSQNPEDWIAVDTPEKTVKFILGIIDEMQTSPQFDPKEKIFLNTLKADLERGTTLLDLMLEKVKDGIDPSKTPWTDPMGGVSERVIDAYYEREDPTLLDGCTPKNYQEALEFLTGLKDRIPNALSHNRIMLSLPNHAMSFLPDHPSMQKLKEMGGVQGMLDFGRKEEEKPIPQKYKDEIIILLSLAKNRFGKTDELNAEDYDRLSPLLDYLKQTECSYKEFFGKIREAINLIKGTAQQTEAMFHKFERILQARHPEFGSSLPSITPLDTNWGDATTTVSFSFRYSLVTGKINMYQSEGPYTTPVSESQWLGGFGGWRAKLINLADRSVVKA